MTGVQTCALPIYQEVSQIIAASEMRDEQLAYSYSCGVLRTEVEIGVNDVYFIRIEK